MSSEPLVIVGAGHAARRAAETLRALDQHARIVMIGAEPELPYDRPVLSKDALTNESGERRAFIHDRAWYDAHCIELHLGVPVDLIDRAAQTVRLEDGRALGYERLLIATGSRVRRFVESVDPDVPLHYVRTVADARALRAALAPAKRVVVLGGGFIGLEVAASAATVGCAVTVIEVAPVLLQRSMPGVVGKFILSMHARHGVDMRLGTRVRSIRRASGQAVVETDRGDIVADVIVIGIGVIPNVELAQKAGLAVENGIVVDEGSRTADPAIFAAGEVTRHFNPVLGRHVRVESWQVAENQPVVAAANMLGDQRTYAEIPWLWSDQYDCNLQTLGLFDADQTIVTRRNANENSVTVLALDKCGTLAAVAAVNAGRDIGVCKRLMAAKKSLDLVQLVDPGLALRSML
ncbi:Anthranilate 1,2-dioxygenase system ferredoxin--NAD(+) reductase component [Paraburkholderia domus]|uniref:anthranilate 1,2-dioxygenase system ferredoxin--NAD(+) reductase n=1 Tax=Paraburkholderia domus TaxID=2793075 RepID=UPI0019119266|nr:anthranilate 1,2-dioxygenase system ferredoxin--NAD(+) reductase [Paraburkholderia domus]MBK5050469.1 FAD-dependent oxidoreductase [Burkholderia sp. R-70006]CAE6754406.1 Anthranilate 1,2-dioxygenase system ferredoxin--NAD(+) reductase component [Paraburkholderia domus]